MRKYVICLTLCAMIFALCWPVWAQQQEKLPRIGFVSETGDPFVLAPLTLRRSGRVCATSVTSKAKIF